MDSPATAHATRPLSRAFQCLVVGHFVAYPMALVWAVAAIPLTIHLSIHEIDALGSDMPAIGRFVVRRLLGPAGGAALIAQLLSLRWALDRHPTAGMRRFFWSLGALAAIGVLGGGASWLWLVFR